jgi:hypothetical protein
MHRIVADIAGLKVEAKVQMRKTEMDVEVVD